MLAPEIRMFLVFSGFSSSYMASVSVRCWYCTYVSDKCSIQVCKLI
jgi:hypothetical protein